MNSFLFLALQLLEFKSFNQVIQSFYLSRINTTFIRLVKGSVKLVRGFINSDEKNIFTQKRHIDFKRNLYASLIKPIKVINRYIDHY